MNKKNPSSSDKTELFHICLEMNEQSVSEFLDAVDFTGSDITVKSVARSPLTSADAVVVDITPLTDVQRKTILHALENGYYTMPRRTNIGEIGERMGVNKSAISQRLRRGECRLIQSTFSRFLPNNSNNQR